ncbi:hypothetical protein QQ054_01045 [Oscillatoria amoena NRMC-F 0135]|nr:hypothetical protein [Oscillatoria amoena NRMC-F 0135]
MLNIKKAEEAAKAKLRGYDGLGRTPRANAYDGLGTVNRYDGMPAGDFTQEPGAIVYTMTLTNANAADRIALISAGFGGTSEAGLISTAGAFNDVNGNAGLTGATDMARSWAQITAFAASCPIQLLGFTIVSTVDGQRAKSVTIYKQSPTRDLGYLPVPMSPDLSAQDNTQKNSRVDLRNVPADYAAVIGSQTQIRLPIAGSSTATIALYFGRIANVEAALVASLPR